ncbi:class I adenylate-forming enzyme family protein [Janibacter indicus]|uniref:class I adenylate-forming enzyme family protein n=1 Tax=Janibacter indicus TaxID=857417 RepID=UPI003D9A4CF6
MAIIDFFDRGWSMDPTAVAYTTGTEVWSYEDAGRMSCRIANGLLADGLQRETKIAVLSPNAPLAWVCVLGIWRAGGAWVPLNPGNPAEDNASLIERFDVETLFYDPVLAPQVEVVRERTPLVRFIALSESTGDLDLQSWVSEQPDTRPEVDYDLDDVIAVSSTGGTTGLPKGVMNTHRSFSVMVAHHLIAFHYEEDERVVNLAAAPMTHSAGILTLHASAMGGSVVIVPRAVPDAILEAIETQGVTELFLPPTALYRLLEVLEERPVDTSSLRYIIYGAAPMSVEKLRVGIEKLGPVFVEVYGQTEAPAAIAFLRPGEHLVGGEIAGEERLGSCGRPYPLTSVAIKDPETGTAVAQGETGEVCVRGDLLMKGYYKDPEQTAATIRDGWLHTGDLGHLDPEGYLRLTDRTKDMIITGGFNVYPSEVEQVIWSHEDVEDCAVVGVPDEDWGEMVTAVVEAKPGRTIDEAEIIALCRAALGPVRTPKQVIVTDQLPRSVNGKVLKKDVRASFWAGKQRAI